MLLLLLCVVLLLAAAVAHIIFEGRKNYAPGPFSFPFLGSRWQGVLMNSIIHERLQELGDKYGNLIFFKLFMGQPILIVRGYDLIKEAKHNRAFTGVGQPLSFKEHGLHRGLGVIFTHGDNWQQMRRFALQALRDQGFGRHSRSDNINEEVSHVVARLVAAAGTGRQVPVKGMLAQAAVNSLLYLVVGTKLDSDEVERLAATVDRVTEAIGPASLHLELFPWLRWVAPRLSGYQQMHDDIHQLVDRFHATIAAHAASLNESEPPRDLVDHFLRRQRSSRPPHAFSDDNLRVLLKDLLIAGLETVNAVMEWVVLMLVRHTEVQARAAAEVDAAIGRDRTPNISDMARMPYVSAVLEETLRWMPVLPVVQQSTAFGAASLGGYRVPANCRLVFDYRSVMHDPAVWGDPERFRPERFLGADAERLRRRITAFGIGLRRCIGQTHSRQSMFLFTCGILQRVELRLGDGQPDPERLEPGLIVRPRHYTIGVRLRR